MSECPYLLVAMQYQPFRHEQTPPLCQATPGVQAFDQ